MFKDRKHAGVLLASALKEYRNDRDVVVLAIPRGGIIAGDITAKSLGVPLEILLVKKIGHPLNKECAIGAVSLEDRILPDSEGVSQEYIESETIRVRDKMRAQYQLFFGDRQPISLTNKKVIIVDDGIATGNTLLMVIEVVKNACPARIIVAVPVGPVDIAAKLESIVDEVVCLETPDPFHAVGVHYQHFPQVENDAVVQILNA